MKTGTVIYYGNTIEEKLRNIASYTVDQVFDPVSLTTLNDNQVTAFSFKYVGRNCIWTTIAFL